MGKHQYRYGVGEFSQFCGLKWDALHELLQCIRSAQWCRHEMSVWSPIKPFSPGPCVHNLICRFAVERSGMMKV